MFTHSKYTLIFFLLENIKTYTKFKFKFYSFNQLMHFKGPGFDSGLGSGKLTSNTQLTIKSIVTSRW